MGEEGTPSRGAYLEKRGGREMEVEEVHQNRIAATLKTRERIGEIPNGLM